MSHILTFSSKIRLERLAPGNKERRTSCTMGTKSPEVSRSGSLGPWRCFFSLRRLHLGFFRSAPRALVRITDNKGRLFCAAFRQHFDADLCEPVLALVFI